MHDGRFKTLEKLVDFYSTLPDQPALGHREESLQPLGLRQDEIEDLVAFLKTLTGMPLDESDGGPVKSIEMNQAPSSRPGEGE